MSATGGGFQVEYAKSGRASCRNTKCKGNIGKDGAHPSLQSCLALSTHF